MNGREVSQVTPLRVRVHQAGRLHRAGRHFGNHQLGILDQARQPPADQAQAHELPAASDRGRYRRERQEADTQRAGRIREIHLLAGRHLFGPGWLALTVRGRHSRSPISAYRQGICSSIMLPHY